MNIEINPYIRRAWYDTLPANCFFPPRVIFDYELMYIKDGHCTVRVCDNIYHARSGDVFLLRPNREHEIKVSSDSVLIQPHIHFDVSRQPDSEIVPINFVTYENVPPKQRSMFRRDVLEEALGPLPDFFHARDERFFEQLLVEVIYANEKKESALDQILCVQSFLQLLYQALYELQLSSSKCTYRRDNTASRIKTYIDHNLNRSISLEEISKDCFVAKCYMIEVFKSVYGITPHAYHKQQRIMKSQHMLRFTNLSISEIASSMGFESIHAFTQKFHDVVGVSPSEYRKKFIDSSSDATNHSLV